MWISIAAALAGFWSMGFMHNFAHGSALRRQARILGMARAQGVQAEDLAKLQNATITLSAADAQRAPDWATVMNFVASLIAIALFVWALFARFA